VPNNSDHLKNLLYILIILLSSTSLIAQNAEVNAKLDVNAILIGEQANIELSVQYQVDEGSISVTFPTLHDTINEFVEIVSKSKIDTLIPNKEEQFIFLQSQTITITSFDSGFYDIPPFTFIVNEDTLTTEPLIFEVQNVAVDTAQAIFDVKAPIEEPFSIIDWTKENWTWLLGILIFIILVVVLIIYLKNKKPIEVVKEIIPEIPPHVIALEELEKVKLEKLWQDGKVKIYHSKISEITRAYIEKRYQFNALEETTAEIMHSLRLHGIDTQTTTKLNQLLVLADLVKFAKEKPLPNENEMSIESALHFVNTTKVINPLPTKNVE